MPAIPLSAYLALSAAMFVIGVIGFLVRRNPLTIRASPPTMTSTGPRSRIRMTLPFLMRNKKSISPASRNVRHCFPVQRISVFLLVRLRM